MRYGVSIAVVIDEFITRMLVENPLAVRERMKRNYVCANCWQKKTVDEE